MENRFPLERKLEPLASDSGREWDGILFLLESSYCTHGNVWGNHRFRRARRRLPPGVACRGAESATGAAYRPPRQPSTCKAKSRPNVGQMILSRKLIETDENQGVGQKSAKWSGAQQKSVKSLPNGRAQLSQPKGGQQSAKRSS